MFYELINIIYVDVRYIFTSHTFKCVHHLRSKYKVVVRLLAPFVINNKIDAFELPICSQTTIQMLS